MSGLYYSEGNCFVNAYINQNHHYKDRKLKLVYGSVSFNGWWEYGGAEWRYADFAAKHSPGSYRWDCHAWLEDDAGNVYDYVFPWYSQVAKINTGRRLPKQEPLIEAESAAQLAARGLVYKAADDFTQEQIRTSVMSYVKSCEADWLRTGKVPGGSLYSAALNWIWQLTEPEVAASAEKLEEDDFATLAKALAARPKKHKGKKAAGRR